MRVLITGATGFIGRPLIRRLIDGGFQTYGLALKEDIDFLKGPDGVQNDLHLIPADLCDATATASAVAMVQPNRIVHLAAAGVTDPTIDSHLAIQHNVYGTLNLIHAAFKNSSSITPPGQLIVIRTPGEAGPSNAYAASKAAAWSFCQMYARRNKWPIVGAMIFQAYGPGQPAHTFVQASLRAALSASDFPMTSGNQARDWIYVDDVADGLKTILDADLRPGTSVDLGTGRRTSLLDVARLVYQLVGRGGAPDPGALPDRAGEHIDLAADAHRTAKLLNWSPQVTLPRGLELVLESLAI